MADDPTMTGDSSGTPPTENAPTTAAPEPTTEPTTTESAPTTLTPPAAPSNQPPAAPRPAMEAPQPAGSHFRNLSHALQGAVLGALAGPHQSIDHYETGADGKMKAVMRDMHPRERLQRMAQAALEGLAAGSRVPPQKSAAAAWGAGIGAGAEATINRGQQQDLLQRKQAQEDFETQEKAKTDNALRAMHLASTYSLWAKAMQEQNDHDPERAKNMDLVSSAKDYISRNPGTSLKVDIVSPEQAKAIHEQEVAALKNDPSHKTKLSTILPLGMTQAKDASGKPLSEADGSPKQIGQVAILAGGESMPVPQTFVNDLKKYGQLAQIRDVDKVAAGQEYPVSTILNWDRALNEVKPKIQDGWKNAADAVLPDGKTHVQMNAFSKETRPYPEGVMPTAVKKEEADIRLKGAEADKAEADAAKARAESTGELPQLLGKDLYQGRLAPPDLAKRKPEFQAQVIKEADRLAKLEGKAGYDFEKDSRDYSFAKNTQTQNTLKYLNSLTGTDNKGGNLATLVQVSDKVRRTSFPALNDIAAWARLETGDPQILQFRTTALEVADQVAKILQGGGTGNGTSDAKLQQAAEMFKTGFTKDQIRSVAAALHPLFGNRKKEMIGNNRYLLKDYGSPLIKAQIPGKPPGLIPRTQEWQFREANPGATVNEIE